MLYEEVHMISAPEIHIYEYIWPITDYGICSAELNSIWAPNLVSTSKVPNGCTPGFLSE